MQWPNSVSGAVRCQSPASNSSSASASMLSAAGWLRRSARCGYCTTNVSTSLATNDFANHR
ncbi:Uncharacterised protein [Mycobacterium tuberculosis]|uniref:Uncharacterized protein n=1 Tax=Mycobacterium tuberculosis TaxID=1773 RepID=A0A916P9Q8_MYCTX|nr:Uncharacterised protein [Mycobacterium tuberculosis]